MIPVVLRKQSDQRCVPQARSICEEDGATAVEYAIMVGLIAVVVVTSVATLGLAVQGLFSAFNTSWP
ncbi:MAG: Flp family type IVb pilin [Planctomycetaceae bacterium]